MRTLTRVLAAAAATLACSTALAQAYPDKPIKAVVPFAAGSATDQIGRAFAQKMQEALGQPIIVDNKPGVNGMLGADAVAKAAPDGYTILIGTNSTNAALKSLMKQLPYDQDKAFAPVAYMGSVPLIIAVNPDVPAKTLKELVEDARKRPNALTFSSSGLYGALHLPTALFMKEAGIQMKHLPTAGGGPALTALLGNNSQVLVSSIAAANAQMRAGKVRPLACFGAARAPALPDVPTMKELGYNVEFYLWIGMFAPKGTPAVVITTMRALPLMLVSPVSRPTWSAP